MGAKRWTAEEDQRLRDAFARGDSIIESVCKFPGRTHDGLLCRANKIGLKHPDHLSWTPEEDVILRELWKTPQYLKEGMHRLPKRSYEAAKTRAQHMKIGRKTPGEIGTRSYVYMSIKTALRNGKKMSMRELSRETGISVKSIQPIIEARHGKGFYVAAWEYVDPNHPVMKWSLGSKPDAPKPPAKTAGQYSRTHRERKRIEQGDFNPFAQLTGLVKIPEGQRGRVFQQSMKLSDFDEELEAA